MTQSQVFEQEDTSKVLRQKIDYTNRLHPAVNLNRPEKGLSEDEKAQMERRHEQQMAELRQEGLKERRILEART
jgi:hypothetical protein